VILPNITDIVGQKLKFKCSRQKKYISATIVSPKIRKFGRAAYNRTFTQLMKQAINNYEFSGPTQLAEYDWPKTSIGRRHDWPNGTIGQKIFSHPKRK
jgi:hypothetical protein